MYYEDVNKNQQIAAILGEIIPINVKMKLGSRSAKTSRQAARFCTPTLRPCTTIAKKKFKYFRKFLIS